MTRDDIIRMAREARLGSALTHGGEQRVWIEGADWHDELERFAALVISHHVKETRPEVSDSMEKWLQQIAYQHGGIGDLSRTEMEFGAMVAAAEREACAKVCEERKSKYEKRASKSEDERDIDPEVAQIAKMTCNFNAAAIRARGEA